MASFNADFGTLPSQWRTWDVIIGYLYVKFLSSMRIT